jgi:creatinine amidohydrolase
VRNKLKYWPGGVWGDPSRATREKGDKAVKLIVNKIVDIIDQIENRKSL